ncbi:response regulator [Deferribacteraceae bacterium V6Fe1]|nr:response regulator [Deferribacteraceae bacterium V6Fe1]
MRYKYKILAVDDDPTVIEALKKNITKQIVFDFVGFTNFDEAYKYLQNNRVDVVLLDVNMPGKDGFECFNIIKKDDKIDKDMPIIFLTVSADEETVNKAFEIGVDDYVIKSKYEAELLARIKRLITERENREKMMQYEKDKVVLQFAGSVAHHFNQPLTALTMINPILSELMATKYPEAYDSIKKYLTFIDEATERLTELVNKISKLKRYSTIEYIQNIDILDLDQIENNESTFKHKNK